MKNWINKYLLLLSMLLLVCVNNHAAPANSSSRKDTGKEAVSQNKVQKQITSFNSYSSSAIFKKAEDRVPTNESSEEEVSASAKKIIKNTGGIITSLTGVLPSLQFTLAHKKYCIFYERPTPFAPYRIYILFRVIRL